MTIKKSSFILVLIGILLMAAGQLFHYGVPIKLNEDTVFTFYVIPEAVCYLLLFIGFFKLRNYSGNFKMAMYFAIAGIIVSVAVDFLKQNYSRSTGFGVVCELVSGLIIIGSFFYYATGIYSVAEKAGLPKTAANASAYRILYSVFKLVSIVLNCIFIISANAVEIVPMWISILSILFSALVYAGMLLIVLLTIKAIQYFPRIPESALQR